MKTVAMWCWGALAALAAVSPALGQYKVIGPDGRVTYTDRPAPGEARAVAKAPQADAVELPYELRQVVSRYPATLYAAPGCSPCERARAMLRQRGVPFKEFTAATTEDAAELQRREGTTDLPILRLGAQRLQGYAADDWQATLDAAGYPRTSRLPSSYRPPAAQPLAGVPAAADRRRPAPAAPELSTPTPILPAASGAFRF